jgi:hypothetical protein
VNQLTFPPIVHFMDPRLGFNMMANGGVLRCTWIAKNMCTSLKFAFVEHRGLLNADALPQFLENPHWIHGWAWPLEPKGPSQLREPQQAAFFVLRDPASRLASALVEKLIYQDDDYQRIVVPVLQYFAGYAGKPPEELTFRDFLQYVEWSPDRALDQHFMSQTSILSGQYTHCFQFEKPHLIAQYLGGYGLSLRKISPHSRASQPTDDLVGLDQRIADVRRAHRGTPPAWFTPDAPMRARIDELVQSRFADDLALWSLARAKGGCLAQ